MIRALLSLVLFLSAQVAFASTDYKCMSDCSNAGYQYSYCKKICSF